MKILTICSSPNVSITPITNLLEQSGLKKGLNNQKTEQSYEQWHEQVFDAYEQDGSGLLIQQALKPGKVWQDMAGQLIYANLDNKQWYWSDSKAAWLLDFWYEMEPQHRFAFIYCSPEIAIKQSFCNTADHEIDISTIIQNWVNYHFEILRFYRTHQDKCLLINQQKCLAHPSEFIELCQQHLGLELDISADLATPTLNTDISYLEQILFEQIAQHFPEVNPIFQEIEASATPFIVSEETSVQETQQTAKDISIKIWHDYRELKLQHRADREQQQQLQNELQEKNKALAQETLQLKTLQLEKSQLIEKKEKEQAALNQKIAHYQQEKAAAQVRIQKLTDEKAELKANYQKEQETLQSTLQQHQQQNKDQLAENELLLLQLHQVQEELEHYFLKYQELEQASRSSDNIIVLQQTINPIDPTLNAQLIQIKPEPDYLAISLINLQWQDQTWFQYDLEIIAFNDATMAIRIPLIKNKDLPLRACPPQTANESGAYWEINMDLLQKETSQTTLYPEDIAFLYALFMQLPNWLNQTEQKKGSTNQDLEKYYHVIKELTEKIQNVYALQDNLID